MLEQTGKTGPRARAAHFGCLRGEKAGRPGSFRGILAAVLFSLLGAILAELLFTFDFAMAGELADRGGAEKVVCGVSSLALTNCRETPEGIEAENGDPFAALGLGRYVKYLELVLKKPAEHSWRMQVFYTTEEEPGYSEENSVVRWVSDYEKRVFIKLDKEVSYLRIDLGDEEGAVIPVDVVIANPSVFSYLRSFVNARSLTRVAVYWILTSLAAFLLLGYLSADELYKKRWLLGAAFIFIWVLLDLNGSSIGIYGSILPGFSYDPLWGVPRVIRTDEYSVFTPMAFSQAAKGFPWFNDAYRSGAPTDMFVVYGQPVKSLMMIFRPFQIGYLFLGASRGLAFYWSSRLAFCFLVSMEFGGLITGKKRKLSFVYAVLISLAPLVQWWFSINCLVEMLIFGQGAVLLLDCYLREMSFRKKMLLMAGMAVCAGGYILALYPAWEIPLFYVFLTCAVCVIARQRKECRFGKKDVLLFAAGVLALAACMGYVIWHSSETIRAVAGTVYPGKRVVLGGGLKMLPELFKSWGNFFLPFKYEDLPMNQCESAAFLDFFPLGLLFSLCVLKKQEKKDVWLLALNAANIFLILFVVCPFPEFLAKLTLLSNCPAERVAAAAGMINIMLLVRSCALYGAEKPVLNRWALGIAALFIFVNGLAYYREFLTVPMRFLLAAFVLFFVLLWNGNFGGAAKRPLASLILCTGVLCGGIVNPINQGTDALMDNPVVRAVERINAQDPGKWVVAGSNVFCDSLPAAVGAVTMNTVHAYPDRAMWERLGLGDREDIWNRYAHISAEISEKPASPEAVLDFVDMIHLSLDFEALKKEGVKYILTDRGFSSKDAAKLLYQNGYCIYRVPGT